MSPRPPARLFELMRKMVQLGSLLPQYDAAGAELICAEMEKVKIEVDAMCDAARLEREGAQ
jgi:hypothetical protein